MSRIELAPEVGDDFERILDHLAQYQVENPALRIREIIEEFNVLALNPMIGRPANNDKRELVIGHRSHGYVALYRYIEEIDTVFSLPCAASRKQVLWDFELLSFLRSVWKCSHVSLCGTGCGASTEAFPRITSDLVSVLCSLGRMASCFIRPWER